MIERKERDAASTLVVVTHNIPSARAIGDELAVLHGGRIIAREARPRELEQSEHDIVRAFMQSQAGG